MTAAPVLGLAGFTGLPAGWVARRIPAGVWIFEEPAPAPARAGELRWPVPDPARPLVVVDGRGGPALEAASAVVRSLAEQGAPRRVRLVLPGLSPFTAQRFADRHGLDVVATSGSVRIGRSHLYTWGFDADRPATFWQWFRFAPGRRPEPFGAIYPAPAWEASLLAAGAVPSRLGDLVPYRIAAGLALLPGGAADVAFLGHAAGIQPDPARITVAVSADHGEAVVVRAVGDLFAALPAARRMRLVCPWSAASVGLWELVRRYDAELLAPDSGVTQDSGSGALLTSGPDGLGRWLRVTANRPAESLGPLHPLPAWRPALRTALAWGDDLVETPSGVRLVRRHGSSAVRVAAAVPPDPERVTIAADGDPGHPADRAAVEHLVASLPDDLRTSFRLVMANAAQGGPRAYGQWLANRFQALVAVATGVPAVAWEPTAPAVAVTVPAWREFGPEEHPAFPPNLLLPPADRPADPSRPGLESTADPHPDPEAPADLHRDTGATADRHPDIEATADPHREIEATADRHPDTRATTPRPPARQVTAQFALPKARRDARGATAPPTARRDDRPAAATSPERRPEARQVTTPPTPAERHPDAHGLTTPLPPRRPAPEPEREPEREPSPPTLTPAERTRPEGIRLPGRTAARPVPGAPDTSGPRTTDTDQLPTTPTPPPPPTTRTATGIPGNPGPRIPDTDQPPTTPTPPPPPAASSWSAAVATELGEPTPASTERLPPEPIHAWAEAAPSAPPGVTRERPRHAASRPILASAEPARPAVPEPIPASAEQSRPAPAQLTRAWSASPRPLPAWPESLSSGTSRSASDGLGSAAETDTPVWPRRLTSRGPVPRTVVDLALPPAGDAGVRPPASTPASGTPTAIPVPASGPPAAIPLPASGTPTAIPVPVSGTPAAIPLPASGTPTAIPVPVSDIAAAGPPDRTPAAPAGPPDRTPAAPGSGTDRPVGPPVPSRAFDASRPVLAEPGGRSAVRDVPVRPLVPRDHQSTDEERLACRARIGARWERHLVAVSRLVNERPALRTAMTAESGDAVAADLSALRAYLRGDLPGLDAALRANAAEDVRAELACCVSGLRLLAAYRGPAYRTAELTGEEAARYSPGDVLAEPAFAAATAVRPRDEGNTLYAIWSRTARRVASLAAGDDEGALLFAAGTAFAVLRVDRVEDAWVVHLDECLRPRRPGPLTDADHRVLAGLDAASAEPADDAPSHHGVKLGLGDRCRYVPEHDEPAGT